MARYVTRMRTDRPAPTVFDDMADLRNFERWDPGVRRARQVRGDGPGPSSEFDVTVAGVGPAPDQTLRYRTVAHRPPDGERAGELVVVASSTLLTSEDRITVEADGSGCIVTYDADLRLAGPLRLLDPLLVVAFGRIGDRAAEGLRDWLAAAPVDR